YALVIARGISSILDFPDTMNLLKKLSERFDPEWTALEKEKESYYQRMVSQIVAFRVKCESVEGKFKLSQNHPLEDRKRVIEALSTADEEGKGMAELMKRTVLNESRGT
ncbi:Transcriptional repressor of sporulation and protease synthase, partial [mine drainage metagenome]